MSGEYGVAVVSDDASSDFGNSTTGQGGSPLTGAAAGITGVHGNRIAIFSQTAIAPETQSSGRGGRCAARHRELRPYARPRQHRGGGQLAVTAIDEVMHSPYTLPAAARSEQSSSPPGSPTAPTPAEPNPSQPAAPSTTSSRSELLIDYSAPRDVEDSFLRYTLPACPRPRNCHSGKAPFLTERELDDAIHLVQLQALASLGMIPIAGIMSRRVKAGRHEVLGFGFNHLREGIPGIHGETGAIMNMGRVTSGYRDVVATSSLNPCPFCPAHACRPPRRRRSAHPRYGQLYAGLHEL